MNQTPSSLYIHIPFCAQKCAYCDFVSFAAKPDFRMEYMKCLTKELQMIGTKYDKPILKTIFVGGGTPSLLTVEEIEMLGQVVHENFDMTGIEEFSIEANPGTLVNEALFKWRSIGVNRISMGVQSMNDVLLKKLGRIHTSEVVRSSFATLRECDFDNINLDIMFGLPDQTYEDMMDTVEKIIELGPEHVSAYSLKIEEGTPFDRLVDEEKIHLPDEDEDRKMYHGLVKRLSEAGYGQYEISNFAKEGLPCNHNLVYWKGQPYFAAGMAAHGYVDGVRIGNHMDFESYKTDIQDGKFPEATREVIDQDDAAFEYIMLGLRLNEGVDVVEYNSLYKRDIEKDFKSVIKMQVESGALEIVAGFMRLTEYGRDIANVVIAEFLD